ncbi:MAG TPA: sigma-70 family RNA polymerase sigma factor [Steroidobacteraceae bacterium]|nr:sigma-70 family RNA polymerase sigma factor [Steroidobacteraceae bacterium]
MDERELVSRMRRGDQQAFNEFFDSFAPRLSSFAARRSSLDAVAIEDVVQMTMINAMRNLGSYRGSAALFTWLCRICRNQLADARRSAARRPPLQSVEELAAERPLATVVELTDFRDPLDECETDSTRGAVRRVVNSLPPHYARILELRFGDELTGHEIARTLGMSEDAAESLLTRARQAFKVAWMAHVESNRTAAAPDRGGAQ